MAKSPPTTTLARAVGAVPPSSLAQTAAFLSAIGREVRKNRAKRGMTRRQLAQASETSERYLAQIESGAGNPSVSVVRAIAQALDLPASALLPESGTRTAELSPLVDLLAQVPEQELPALAKELAARGARARGPAPRGKPLWSIFGRGGGNRNCRRWRRSWPGGLRARAAPIAASASRLSV